MKIISRKEARAAGLPRYFTGNPCPHGHISERRTKNSVCLQCILDFGRKWYAANRDHKLAQSKRVYRNNREAIIVRTDSYRKKHQKKYNEWSRQWRADNPGRAYASSRRWIKAHPEKAYQYNRNARAKRKEASGSHTHADIQARLKWQRGKCAVCNEKLGRRFDIDHYIPLSRGGHNNPSNIQILCPGCNKRKHAHDPVDFYRSQGFLL